jgi:hypothetical protein
MAWDHFVEIVLCFVLDFFVFNCMNESAGHYFYDLFESNLVFWNAHLKMESKQIDDNFCGTQQRVVFCISM